MLAPLAFALMLCNPAVADDLDLDADSFADAFGLGPLSADGRRTDLDHIGAYNFWSGSVS